MHGCRKTAPNHRSLTLMGWGNEIKKKKKCTGKCIAHDIALDERKLAVHGSTGTGSISTPPSRQRPP